MTNTYLIKATEIVLDKLSFYRTAITNCSNNTFEHYRKQLLKTERIRTDLLNKVINRLPLETIEVNFTHILLNKDLTEKELLLLSYIKLNDTY